jgi:hypothetical protein
MRETSRDTIGRAFPNLVAGQGGGVDINILCHSFQQQCHPKSTAIRGVAAGVFMCASSSEQVSDLCEIKDRRRFSTIQRMGDLPSLKGGVFGQEPAPIRRSL